VTHIQGLGCEGIRLHLHICSGNLVDETGLADVGKSLKKRTGKNRNNLKTYDLNIEFSGIE
jgi:hypothetical protein